MTQGTTKKSTGSSSGFSAEERAAMKERARELKAKTTIEEDEKTLIEAIEALSEPERTWANKLHAIVKAHAPNLLSKTWYGMIGYARDGKNVCFFQSADKFKARYATLGFNDTAHLDEDAMWPVAYALKEWTPAVEAKITELIKRAAG